MTTAFYTPWHIQLLGGFCAQQEDHVLSRFRTHKTGSLLAYLAYTMPRMQVRETLIEMLWPDCTTAQGRNHLSMTLTFLRNPMEPPGVTTGAVIIADRHSVGLNSAGVTTDVAAFEALLLKAEHAANTAEQMAPLVEAIALYTGELLPGYYESWILGEQQRLSERFSDAIGRLIVHSEQTGNLAVAVEYAQQAVRHNPLQEKSNQQLIRLYARTGQPNEALRHFDQMKQRFIDELGAAPSPATTYLVQRVEQLMQEAAQSIASGQTVLPSVSSSTSTSPSTSTSSNTSSSSVSLVSSNPSGSDAISDPIPLKSVREDVPPSTVNGHSVNTDNELAQRNFSARLPPQFTRFFGRENELSRLRLLLLPSVKPSDALSLSSSRLVTLTGSGGTGKTRLALQLAAYFTEILEGAVWFVPLAEVTNASRVVEAIHEALRLPRQAQSAPMEQITALLSQRPSLLILDNFEQLLTETDEDSSVRQSTAAVQTLLTRVPELAILTTSRQRLNIAGEREFIVAPLSVPLPASSHSASSHSASSHSASPLSAGGIKQDEKNIALISGLLSCPSVQLFVDRAQLSRPDFQITERNAQDIAAICIRLEGIPLALELAAARAQVLSLRQMLVQIEDRFTLLASKRRDLPPRQLSVRSAIDWSYRLLNPDSQRFFARLGVFRGGWTLEAAQSVCQEPLALDYLAQLRDSSLITTFEPPEDPDQIRFRMLETLREYAWEQLASEDRIQMQCRHQDYYLEMLNEAGQNLAANSGQAAALQMLESDQGNLRAALDWSLKEPLENESIGNESIEKKSPEKSAADEAPLCLQLALLMWPFWFLRGHLKEAQTYFDALLARQDIQSPTFSRGKLLSARGTVAAVRGDYAAARAFYEESLSIMESVGHQRSIALTLNNLGNVALESGDYVQSGVFYARALPRWQAMNSPVEEAKVLHNLGIATDIGRDYALASSYYERSLQIKRQFNDMYGMAVTLDSLGAVACRQGDDALAGAYLLEALQLARQLGAEQVLLNLLVNFAQLARLRSQFQLAVRLHAATHTLMKQSGVSNSVRNQQEAAAFETAVRSVLSTEEFMRCQEEGQAMSLEQAIEAVLEELAV